MGEVDGVLRGEGAGVVGAGALVGEDPEVELLEESGEVGEGEMWVSAREAAHPQVGAHLDGVLFHQVVGVVGKLVRGLLSVLAVTRNDRGGDGGDSKGEEEVAGEWKEGLEG